MAKLTKAQAKLHEKAVKLLTVQGIERSRHTLLFLITTAKTPTISISTAGAFFYTIRTGP